MFDPNKSGGKGLQFDLVIDPQGNTIVIRNIAR
jgi:hypothetical protein